MWITVRERVAALLKRQAAMRLRPDCMVLEMIVENSGMFCVLCMVMERSLKGYLGILTAPIFIYMYGVPNSSGQQTAVWLLATESAIAFVLELLVDYGCIVLERNQGVCSE